MELEIEHSYYENNRKMPKLEVEEVQDQEKDLSSTTMPRLDELNQHPATSTSSVPMVATTSINRRKAPLLSNTDFLDDLEDEDLHFKGFCYTTTGYDLELNDTHACPNCPAVFDSRVGLTNHSKLHGATKHMKCNLCDFACTNKKTMRVHRRIHGIIPVRGRRPDPEKQKAKLEKRIKVEQLELMETPPIGQISKKQSAAEQKTTKGEKAGRPTRRRITKSSKESPSAGAVDANEIAETEEEPFVIISAANQNTPAIQTKKRAKKVAGLEEEEEYSSSDHDSGPEKNKSPKRKFRKRRKRQEQYSQQRPGTSQGLHMLACTVCPYLTPSTINFDNHLLGHSRLSGYVCSVCNFKHEYKRWLQYHCTLHEGGGIECKWPPEYVYGDDQPADGQEEVAGDFEDDADTVGPSSKSRILRR